VFYATGELKPLGVEDGKEVASINLSAANPPESIRLKADRETVNTTRNALSYVTGEIKDHKDNVAPNADIPVFFQRAVRGH
jgi:beta-galactosidase